MSHAELADYRGRGKIPRTLPLHRGDGGEYTVTVDVEVT